MHCTTQRIFVDTAENGPFKIWSVVESHLWFQMVAQTAEPPNPQNVCRKSSDHLRPASRTASWTAPCEAMVQINELSASLDALKINQMTRSGHSAILVDFEEACEHWERHTQISDGSSR